MPYRHEGPCSLAHLEVPTRVQMCVLLSISLWCRPHQVERLGSAARALKEAAPMFKQIMASMALSWTVFKVIHASLSMGCTDS